MNITNKSLTIGMEFPSFRSRYGRVIVKFVAAALNVPEIGVVAH